MHRWLTTAEFGRLAAIHVVNARKALRQAYRNSKSWNGLSLTVRLAPAAGGPGGLGYEVQFDRALQERFKASQISTLLTRAGVSNEATRRLNIIASIVQHERGTPERRTATAAVLAAHQALTETTLRRWVKAHDERGIAALAPRHRSDKGVKRCLISALWFAQVRAQLDMAAIEKIERALGLVIRSQYGMRESPKYILTTATLKLRELTIAAGFVVTGETPRHMFDVPRAYMLKHSLSRRAGRRRLDAKAEHDPRPAIRRRLAARPGQVVDIDAMHFDHIVTRPDGTPAYPKAIVYVDRATHQATVHCFLLAAGEGLTQKHVALSVAQFFEERGVPETIYIDNGGEFGALGDLSDMMQLVAQVHSTAGRKPFVHARPYGARSKIVETIIGVLQRVWFAGLPGHVGNNRINRVTQQVGRPTAPFPGTFEEFNAAVQLRVRMYNAAAQRGKLQGRSPDEVLQSHIDANTFERHGVDRASLMLAFSTRETRKVHPYGIQMAGGWWRCPETDYRAGETIGVLKGRFYDWPVVPLYDLAAPDTIIGYAEPHVEVDGMDPANAKEQRQREKRFHRRGRELVKSAGRYDPVANTHAMAALLPPPPTVPIAGTIVPNPKAAEIVANITEHPETRHAKHLAKAEQDQLRDNARSQRAMRRLQGGNK